MQVIHEYRLAFADREQCIEMPIGSHVISVSAGNSIRMLAVSPAGARLSKRWFSVRVAGCTFGPESEGRFVGTVDAGRTLWAVFDVTFCVLSRPSACQQP